MVRCMRCMWVLTTSVGLLVGCGQSSERAEESYSPQIDPARFVSAVDNEFFPLVPGTAFVYQEAGGSERAEVYVTDDTRIVMGVICVVVRSMEFDDGELVEETFDWYAQDADGNVWYFGEDTKEYEDGEVSTTAGSWEAGVNGALPGIIMPGSPVIGEPYRQEYYAGHAEDMGEVLRLGDAVTVPEGSYEGVLVTRDWTPLEPGAEEEKYYAPGVGLVLEVEGRARIELVEVVRGTTGRDG